MRRSRRALLRSRRASQSCRAGGAARIASSAVSRRYRKTGHRKKGSREVRGWALVPSASPCGCSCRAMRFFQIPLSLSHRGLFRARTVSCRLGSGRVSRGLSGVRASLSACSALFAPSRSAIPSAADRSALIGCTSSRRGSPSASFAHGHPFLCHPVTLLQVSQNRRSCIVKR